MNNSHVVAIWNPASGGAPDEADLQKALGPDVKLVPTTEDDPGPGQARDAVQAGADIVVACGGDGTVRACLDSLADTGTALAVVPLGTGNLLASNLDLENPSGLAAASGIGRGTPRLVDIGRVNGEAFAVMAGSGFDALMIRDANDKLKSRLGTVAYVISALRNLRTETVGTEIAVDGQPWFSGRTSMVLIGNFGTISGGIDVFPAADPNDGKLDIAVLSISKVGQWARFALALLRGTDNRLDFVTRTTASTINVVHDRPRIYELDGEDRPATTALNISIQPSAVAVHQQ